MNLPAGAQPPPDEYFASEFNQIRKSKSQIITCDSQPQWGIRGFLPPAHLRIELYRYVNGIKPDETNDDDNDNYKVPLSKTPRTPKNGGESIEMLVKGVLA